MSTSIETLYTSLREHHQLGIQGSVDLRVAQLKNLRKVLIEHEAEIASAVKADLGKHAQESFMSEFSPLIGEIDYACRHLHKWAKPKRVPTPMALMPGRSFIQPEARGVVLIIAPWNYPIVLALAPLIGAIAAGCSALVKPSEHSAESSKVIAKVIAKAFSPSVATCVQGGVEETTALLKLKWDHIFFTGSPQVGRIVARAAAEHLTTTTLELGGKNPTIVTAHADIEMSARRIAWGKLFNNGQTCLAPDILYVHESVHAKFVAKLREQITAMYGTDAKTNDSYGRIINTAHTKRLKAMISGGKVISGGTVSEDERYIAPTLIENAGADSALMKEEIFGPLLPIVTFKSLDDLIEDQKQNEKPLAAYLFSDDKEEQSKFVHRISFGGGCINDTLIHFANHHLPFGGVGMSGSGAYHGKRSFDTFTHEKAIVKKGKALDLSIRYAPYSLKKLSLLRWLLG